MLALPVRILCTDECRGLCAICGANLNEDPEHAHEREPDPRWAKLSELRARLSVAPRLESRFLAIPQSPERGTRMSGYQLEGSLLEVCSCDVLCPCWIGEDPDQGTCDAVVAYHFDKGTIDGVDVSGLTLVGVANIPGNVLEGNWRQLVYVDDDGIRRAGGRDPRCVHRQARRPARRPRGARR